jgi:hypothetical protein
VNALSIPFAVLTFVAKTNSDRGSFPEQFKRHGELPQLASDDDVLVDWVKSVLRWIGAS